MKIKNQVIGIVVFSEKVQFYNIEHLARNDAGINEGSFVDFLKLRHFPEMRFSYLFGSIHLF